MSVMQRVILSFSSLLLLALSVGAQSVPPEGSTTTILVTAEMGSGFAGGSITAQQVVPRGTMTSPRSFFFDSSGNVTMTLVGGTWQFRFCNTSGVCFNSQGAFSTGNFDITAIFTSSISSGGGGTPAPPDACLQINKGGAFGTASNLCLDSSTSPTTLTEPEILSLTNNFIGAGPNPYIDITSPTYGARQGVINTTGTGSGTALSVGTSAFANGNGITIVGAGAAPVIAAPAGLTVTPGIAAGMTTPDGPIVAGATGASTYNYRIFAMDVTGGTTVPTSTVTITNGNSALGALSYAISTWSLTGNQLTIVTTATNALVQNTVVHITGTSNNALAEGWYPISSITNGTTFVINNVPQFSSGTTAGTGGTVATFLANRLSWTASTGGSGSTLPFEYGICAQRPGDASFHLVAMSLPSTLYSAVTSTVFNDYGPTLTANPILPYYLSDANCTAGAAQNRLFTTTVASGGGTANLTLATSMTNSVAGAVVRLDNAPALTASATAAKANGAAGVSIYIPATPISNSFVVNSPVFLPGNLSIWQVGNLTINQPILVAPSTNWTGFSGIQGATSFAFNGAPLNVCNSYPCIYVSGVGAQSNGADTYYNLAFQTQTQNGLLFVVDAAWGQIWERVNFVSGQNNNDNMGIDLMIRPGAAQYKVHNCVFGGGPNQLTDQTWAPLVYGNPGNFGNAGPMDFDNNMFNRRGVYILDNGGPSQAYNFHGFYRQGGITPMLTIQNTNGNVGGQVNIDFIQHDTENEAALAVLCGVGCAPGFSTSTGMVFKVGFSSAPSNDGATIPPNITGGGSAQPTITLDAVSAGSSNGPTQPGWFYNGHDIFSSVVSGVNVPELGINTPSSSYNLDVNGTVNVAQYQDFVQIATPPNPPSGKCRLFNSSSLLSMAGINSSGLSCLSGGGGGSSSLPNNQIFVGNASNVAAPVPMSLDANIINTGAVTVIGTNGLLLPASATLTATNSLKQIIAATLPSAQIYVGSAGNLPVALSPSGDVTISNTGVFTLASVGTAGACGSATQFCQPTFDAKGRETSVSTVLAGVPINSTLGTSPYTIQTSDRVSLLNTNPSSTFTINLFNPATTGFGSNMPVAFRNYGTADYTLTAPGGVNLNTVTAGSLRVPGNWVGFLWSDTNLWLSRLPSFEAFPSTGCGDSTHALAWAPASTPPIFCQAISTSAAAGGSNTQLQYNNATALGGIAAWTTNGTTSLLGGATAVFDIHAGSSANYFLPGNLPTGLVRVTTSTGAISSAELSGDVTTSGSNATTLATVNSNTGSQTPATITVNGKGLVTALLSIPDVTTTVGTTAIGANSCTTATTVTMTGLTSTMTFSFTPNADVSGVTGWGSAGGLVVDAWPTTNTLNYKVCNQTGSSITPSSSVTFNVSAR